MQILFRVVSRNEKLPDNLVNIVYLKIDNWNDYSFVTMFQIEAYDEKGQRHSLPNIKIGFSGQSTSVSTHETLDKEFIAPH